MRSVKHELKAERVQEPEATLAPVTALKAERVQEFLKSMPGWSLLPGARAIGHVRELGTPAHVEAFVTFVARLSMIERHPVTIDLTPTQVIVTLRGQTQTGCTVALTENVLALATAIG
jgi:pterin-4a-carbinolamine dehydratase